ncbi:MAG: peptide MFS transporter [Sphingobacteriales bacterium]|jgi:POT family proton-dependent oligopeptide transporter|nr:peptide MFS transporter [Sphingobacteriales bacterium]
MSNTVTLSDGEFSGQTSTNETYIADNVNGHPKQLALLFFTEMWERFSFYGMRALLVLFMVHQLHYEDAKANLIYGTYTALVYLMPLFGGIAADKFIGYRKAIVLGGALMAAGHLILAIPTEWSFFAGMAFLISGNGFFKPNISTMVGRLYRPGDARRDGAFSIFYMGVNLGAAIGGLICGYIGQSINWHYGFGLAGIFMIVGLITFLIGKKSLGEIGLTPKEETGKEVDMSKQLMVLAASLAIIPLFILLFNNYTVMSKIMFPVCIVATVGMVFIAFQQEKEARDKMLAAIVLVAFSVLFWAFYEQGGGSLNLYTERNVNTFGMPAAAINNFINPFYIILLSFPFAWMWLALSERDKEPSTPMKFSLSFFQLGLGFFLFVVGAKLALNGQVGFFWYALGYLLLTTGELCISPIGLSMITKLSPTKYTGMMMGFWFLASALGQHLAGWIGTLMAIPSEGGATTVSAIESLGIYSGVFMKIFYVSAAGGLVILILVPILKRWSHGVK